MSVKAEQSSIKYQTTQQQQSVYDKFQKVHQNMSNFQQMLTKFSTNRKHVKTQPDVQAFCLTQSSNKRNRKNMHQTNTLKVQNFISTNILLEDGWQYSGNIFQSKFHGFGNLIFNEKSIYMGEFKHGKMNGLGKINFHQLFQELIDINSQWIKYEGQFKDGCITGYGNLFLSDGMVITGYWVKGKPQYFTKVQQPVLLI